MRGAGWWVLRFWNKGNKGCRGGGFYISGFDEIRGGVGKLGQEGARGVRVLQGNVQMVLKAKVKEKA